MPITPRDSDTGQKRKRDIIPEDEDDKLEIDVTAPEPPSKKAKRKEKKQLKSKSRAKEQTTEEPETSGADKPAAVNGDNEEKRNSAPAANVAKRSDYGIWIGNLPFTATKDSLRRFLLNEGGIDDSSVTRIHMPADKGHNKGFAYIDFTTSAVLDTALALSESMVEGRSVLIKNAKSFEGRPKKNLPQDGATSNVSTKEPNTRIWVGNLDFSITQEELTEHFRQAGQVDHVHMATFEDSGKCKGFGWITFADLEAAKNAVQGFIFKEPELEDDEDEEDAVVDEDDKRLKRHRAKQKKPKKWFINRIHGRELKREYAEDAQTRYKKRFGKGSAQSNAAQGDAGDVVAGAEDSLENLAQQAAAARASGPRRSSKPQKLDRDQRQDERRKRHDARKIAPGKALANKTRASTAIVAPTGTKMTFD